MAARSLRSGQIPENSQATGNDVRTESTSSALQYLNKSELDGLTDDDMSDLIEEQDEERNQEELQGVDVDLNDQWDDEYADFDEEELDAFHASDRLDAYCRPVWIWVGGGLIWCHSGRGGDPYKGGWGESLRLLVEWSAKNFWGYFPWMNECGRKSDPRDASGFFAKEWLKEAEEGAEEDKKEKLGNLDNKLHRLVMVIPSLGAKNVSLMSVSSFFGDSRGRSLPEVTGWLWFRKKWLPGWCDENGTSEEGFLDIIGNGNISWDGQRRSGFNGFDLCERYRMMLKNNFIGFIRDAAEFSGLDLNTGKRNWNFSGLNDNKEIDAFKASFRKKTFEKWKGRLRREVYGDK